MELYAKIITDDKRFERMLSLELSDCGIRLISDIDSLYNNLTRDNFFTIVDLDFCREDISELCERSKVIGFAYAGKNEVGKEADRCHAFFNRPFLMADLLSAIFGDDNTRHFDVIRAKRSSVAASRKKRDILAIDHGSSCALFGKERISLTEGELKVLSALDKKRGSIVGREELSKLFGADQGNICDVYICMLRRKLDNRIGIKFIYTVRGKGYMLK